MSERERLYNKHEYLIGYVIKSFTNGLLHDVYDDAVQAGRIGLWVATSRYEASRGALFSTFAWWYIYGEILHLMRDVPRPGFVVQGNRGTKERMQKTVEVQDDDITYNGERFDRINMQEELRQALAPLDRRSKAILLLNAVYNVPETRLAKFYGVSQRHISRLLTKARNVAKMSLPGLEVLR